MPTIDITSDADFAALFGSITEQLADELTDAVGPLGYNVEIAWASGRFGRIDVTYRGTIVTFAALDNGIAKVTTAARGRHGTPRHPRHPLYPALIACPVVAATIAACDEFNA